MSTNAGRRVTNDWDQIRGAVFSNLDIRPTRAAEVWRWTALVRHWADENRIDIRTAGDGDVRRFLDEVEATSGARNPDQRKWAFGKLVDAAQSLKPTRAHPASLAATLDRIPARSPLGKALSRVLSRATCEANRRMWPTCLGAFLAWCDERGLDPVECWLGDLAAFKRDRIDGGYRSPGEYVRVARMLLKELSVG